MENDGSKEQTRGLSLKACKECIISITVVAMESMFMGNRLGAKNGYNIDLIKELQGMKLEMKGIMSIWIGRSIKEEYSCGRGSQTLGTTSRPLSYNNLKLPLLWCTFGLKIIWHGSKKWNHFLFLCVREEEKFQLVLKSLSYEVNVWWDCKCENRKKVGEKPIRTWSLMKQALRIKYGVGNHEELGQCQPMVKFVESSMVEESQKVIELSQAKIKVSLKINAMEKTSKEKPCIMSKKSIEIKEKEKVEEK
ncbi:hypothetical protein M9H77_02485 [Catharanthus roseus]|uniref:Uncharacterized protein n=1 Tax=Catharanthus roseus TaxID=4058 RepID=A0ACC0C8X5_CATRO|nr:hypothetical protein M9H77_02485 [Catharanthus roseus]